MYLNENILFMAFRYALGRKTYIVNNIVEIIISKWDELSLTIKTLMHKEIKEAFYLNKAGDSIDKQEWEKLLELPL